jgi:DNA-binding MarR family transcriptional regulator
VFFHRYPILIKLYFLLSSAVSNLAEVTVGKKKTSPRVTKAEYEALAAFRYSLRQFLSFSELAAASAGITPRQYQALLAIQGFPGRDSATIGELAEQLQIAHHSAVGLVDRLVAQKLIVRLASAEDRRQVYVTVTAHGIEILDKLASAHKDELRRLGPRLNSIVFALNRQS